MQETRKLIGMLYRSLYQHFSPKTLLKLYLTKIKPHLEYASPVWDPFRKGEIEELENVQKFALRMCLKSWDMDYSELLEKSHIWYLRSAVDTLEQACDTSLRLLRIKHTFLKLLSLFSRIHSIPKLQIYWVELPNNGHIGSGPFVLYIEVVPL